MRNAKGEVLKGFASAAVILLVVIWLGLVFGGMAILFSPNARSPIWGWGLLLLAAVVFFVTMDRWVKAFPGLLVLATLNSLIELKTGHSLNDASVVFPRLQAAIFALCVGASAFVTLRFRTTKLNAVDRMAIFVFVASIFCQAIVPRFQALAGSVAFGSLLLAWMYGRFRGSHDRSHGSLSTPQT